MAEPTGDFATMTGTLSAVVTRADGTVEDLGVISVLEVPPPADDEEND